MHERIVTGGGKASVKLPQFQAVNSVLSNLKTAMAGHEVNPAAAGEVAAATGATKQGLHSWG